MLEFSIKDEINRAKNGYTKPGSNPRIHAFGRTFYHAIRILTKPLAYSTTFLLAAPLGKVDCFDFKNFLIFQGILSVNMVTSPLVELILLVRAIAAIIYPKCYYDESGHATEFMSFHKRYQQRSHLTKDDRTESAQKQTKLKGMCLEQDIVLKNLENKINEIHQFIINHPQLKLVILKNLPDYLELEYQLPLPQSKIQSEEDWESLHKKLTFDINYLNQILFQLRDFVHKYPEVEECFKETLRITLTENEGYNF